MFGRGPSQITSIDWRTGRREPRGDTILFGLGGFFQRAQSRIARLMTIRADGTGLEALTREGANAGMPSWSPDGRQVVYRARG